MPLNPSIANSLVVNATDVAYGADKTGKADSTTAILSACVAANGGPVFLPSGIYKVSSPLLLSVVGTQLWGAGAQSTILQPSASFLGSNVINITANYCGVRDLSINGISANYASNPAADAIQITGAQNVLIQNVSMYYINGWCIQSSASSSVRNKWTKFDNVFSTLCAKGMHVVGTAANNNAAHVITNCILDQVATGSSNGDGYFIEDCYDIECSNLECNISAGSGVAFHIKGRCASIHLTNFVGGCDAPVSTGPACLIESGTNGTPAQIELANSVFETGSIGVSITAGTEISVTDCRLLSNTFLGMGINSPSDTVIVKGCSFNGNGASAGSNHFDLQTDTFGNVMVIGCSFLTPTGTGAGQTQAAIDDSSVHAFFTYNIFLGTTIFQNIAGIARANNGFNPGGPQTAPSVPASGTAIQNTFGFDCMVHIIGGTITAIAIGRTSGSQTSTGLTSSAAGVTIFLAAQQWIKLTYSVAPTWTWFGE